MKDHPIILGDFNIFKPEDVRMEAITAAGFVVSPPLQDLPGGNVDQSKFNGQIAYFKKLHDLDPTGRSGIFDFFKHVS